MKLRNVILLGFALVAAIQMGYAFKKKEKLALAFLAGMVIGQGRHGSGYPVPVPWPMQGGNQVMPLPLPIPIGGSTSGNSGGDKKVVHNLVKHHHHLKNQHDYQLESPDAWQGSEWPQKFGGHARFLDDNLDFDGFGEKFGGNSLGQGHFDSPGGFGNSFAGTPGFGGFNKKFFPRYWGSSPPRQRYFLNDESSEDYGSSFGSYGAFPKYSAGRFSLYEGQNDYGLHSLLAESAPLKTAESSHQPKSQHVSSSLVSHRPVYRTLVSVSDKPPAVRQSDSSLRGGSRITPNGNRI